MRILSLRALAAKLTAEGLPTPVLQNSPKAAYGALRVLASNWPPEDPKPKNWPRGPRSRTWPRTADARLPRGEKEHV
jgi:hypothetical protein